MSDLAPYRLRRSGTNTWLVVSVLETPPALSGMKPTSRDEPVLTLTDEDLVRIIEDAHEVYLANEEAHQAIDAERAKLGYPAPGTPVTPVPSPIPVVEETVKVPASVPDNQQAPPAATAASLKPAKTSAKS